MSALEEEQLPEEYRTEGNVPVLNQGCNSDCVAHAIAVATAYGQYKVQKDFNDFSRGYIYGNRRALDWQGEGMYVRQALKNFNHDGDCLNTKFPYRGNYPTMKAKIAEKPEEYAEAAWLFCQHHAVPLQISTCRSNQFRTPSPLHIQG